MRPATFTAFCVWAAAAQTQREHVPVVVTPDHVTREMLRLAEVGPNDFDVAGAWAGLAGVRFMPAGPAGYQQ